ncbi:fimbria/pilus outer membrane usher protein [Utexia brackfieldae]|uniref:fimbria/pilus outer membrane usher protein n=1 Tax=Utexia brackfieldae TaxID=3074108 RepID=UPI00370D84D8
MRLFKGIITFSRFMSINIGTLIIYLAIHSPVIYAAETAQSNSADDDYLFDSSLLRGNRFNIGNLSRFNDAGTVEPGTYKVDLYVNNLFSEQLDVKFIQSASGKIVPVFSRAFLLGLGIKPEAMTASTSSADANSDDTNLIPDEVIQGAKSTLTFSNLKLDLAIPQALMKTLPRGYVAPDKLDSGETMLFVNYMANQYHVGYKNSTTKSMDSSYINLNGGFNLGLWRYRQQSYYTQQSGGDGQFVTTNRYVQRAIVPLQSELLIGEGYTNGNYFSGMGFRGISLNSDDRMLPDSQQGYAPIVNGVARTNAKVTITQGGSIIYETTVPPGPFTINDLYSTNYSGDLQVSVQEADGSISSFTVPFASVPGSLRAGTFRYNMTVGKSRFVGDNNGFAELVFRRGISNAVTINMGSRIAKDYYSALLGGVYTSWLGAIGFDTTFSTAQLPTGSTSGWKARLSYSKAYEPTNTSFSVSTNYYSTSGFRELSDVLGVREAMRSNGYDNWHSETYNQRSRFDLSINQSLGKLGSLFLSGAIQNYYGNHRQDKQLQLSYGKVFANGMSLNVSVNRTTMGATIFDGNGLYEPSNLSNKSSDTKETTMLVSLSVPFGRSTNSPIFTNSVSHSNTNGTSLLSSLSGSIGESQNLNYSVNYSTDSHEHIDTWNGSLQSRLPIGTVGLSGATSDNYWQTAATMQGALVVHRGGVTLGPYVGDTFAIVQADGARGAKIVGGQGSSIDWLGYALVPSLSPYRYNTIILSPEGMNSTVELESGQFRVAPYAGAAVKVNFRTDKGYPVLITAIRPDGMAMLPMGAEVFNSDNHSIGMVGQGGQIYVRANQLKDTLTIQWGNTTDEQCKLTYDLDGQDLKQPLILLKATCQ